MCFKLLNLVLQVGKVFALTPPSTQPNEITKKNIAHSVFILILLFLIVISKFVSCSYCNFEFDKGIVLVARDISQYFFICSIVLITLLKRNQWRLLISNIKASKWLSCDANPERVSPYLKFIISHLFFWTINIYTQCTLTRLYGLINLKENISKLTLLPYLCFIHSLYVYSILEILVGRYQSLNRQILSPGHTSIHDSCQMENAVVILNQTVDCLNNIIGWPMMFQIFYCMLTTVNSFHNMIAFDYKPIGLCIELLILGPTFMLCFTFEAILKEARKCLMLINRSVMSVNRTEDRRKIYEFADIFRANFPKFSGVGLFENNMATILKIFGTAITFVIVLVQFDLENASKNRSKSTNCSSS